MFDEVLKEQCVLNCKAVQKLFLASVHLFELDRGKWGGSAVAPSVPKHNSHIFGVCELVQPLKANPIEAASMQDNESRVVIGTRRAAISIIYFDTVCKFDYAFLRPL